MRDSVAAEKDLQNMWGLYEPPEADAEPNTPNVLYAVKNVTRRIGDWSTFF